MNILPYDKRWICIIYNPIPLIICILTPRAERLLGGIQNTYFHNTYIENTWHSVHWKYLHSKYMQTLWKYLHTCLFKILTGLIMISGPITIPTENIWSYHNTLSVPIKIPNGYDSIWQEHGCQWFTEPKICELNSIKFFSLVRSRPVGGSQYVQGGVLLHQAFYCHW